MKHINFTFNFTVPDDYDPKLANELIYSMLEKSWSEIRELNYYIEDYYVYDRIEVNDDVEH